MTQNPLMADQLRAVSITSILYLLLSFRATAEDSPNAERSVVPVLRQAVASKTVPGDLKFDVGWRDRETYHSIELWGDGVGIRDDRRQFRIPPGTLIQLMESVVDSEFDSLARSIDEEEEPGREEFGTKEEPRGEGALRVRLRVGAGGSTRDVFRTVRDRSSPQLENLVGRIATICSPFEKSGVETKDLDEALGRLIRGELAPQMLQFSYQVLDENAGQNNSQPGFLIHFRGRALDARTSDRTKGMGPEIHRTLTQAEFRDLVKALQAARLGSAPAALYSNRYEDLWVKALQHVRSFQARNFAGFDAKTNRVAQKAYEGLRTRLTRLFEETSAAEKRRSR